jgi:hypothetical protein
VSWTSPATPPAATEDRAPGAEHHAPVGDRRGLTAAGAVTIALILGAAGASVDVLTGPGLRTVFAVCFIAGCAIAAATVHREDLVAAVVMPPLVYVVLAFAAGAFSHTTAAGSMLTRQALELASSLVLGAPVLLTATGLALVIALIRGARGRSSRARQP